MSSEIDKGHPPVACRSAVSTMKQLAPLLAEERLLMAEEKWIVEALLQIKKQRNCIEIEKLHLQSMKAALKMSKLGDMKTEKKPDKQTRKQEAAASSAPCAEEIYRKMAEQYDDAVACNQKEMDLSISNRLSQILDNTFQEEYDEECSEEESDEDNDFFVLGQDQQSADISVAHLQLLRLKLSRKVE